MSSNSKQKFKVGDRVRHEKYGEGVVMGEYEEMVLVEFDKAQMLHDCHGQCAKGKGWYCYENDLTLIAAANPDPTASPTPDRAMIAARLLRTFVKKYSVLNAEDAAKKSVEFTDALIAELQNPKQ